MSGHRTPMRRFATVAVAMALIAAAGCSSSDSSDQSGDTDGDELTEIVADAGADNETWEGTELPDEWPSEYVLPDTVEITKVQMDKPVADAVRIQVWGTSQDGKAETFEAFGAVDQQIGCEDTAGSDDPDWEMWTTTECDGFSLNKKVDDEDGTVEWWLNYNTD